MKDIQERLEKAVTDWMFRMRDLGELKDFLNSKVGFYAFTCPELTEIVSLSVEEKEKEIRDAFIEHYKGAGEVFFPYPSKGNCTAEEAMAYVMQEWDEVMETLASLSPRKKRV